MIKLFMFKKVDYVNVHHYAESAVKHKISKLGLVHKFKGNNLKHRMCKKSVPSE